MSNPFVIIFNAGSSSLKFSLFPIDSENLNIPLYKGQVKNIHTKPIFEAYSGEGKQLFTKDKLPNGYTTALSEILKWIDAQPEQIEIIIAGHRVVHGGKDFIAPTLINPEIIAELKKLIPLAPLHQPQNVEVMEILAKLHPNLPQLACFDTAFHTTKSRIADLTALPRKFTDEGVIRYGFHGLSYQYIASILAQYAGQKAHGKVIVAHLGNGASMCAMDNLQSVETTMSFTPLDGLMMGTRCGNIDPGIILHLMEHYKMSATEISDLLYNESGLLGVSGISGNMKVLLDSNDPLAQEAIDLFCYQAAKQLGALITVLGGLDVLVFTAGIGEESDIIRQKICSRLNWLGLELNSSYNNTNRTVISTEKSKVDVYVIPTNEELVIVKECLGFLG